MAQRKSMSPCRMVVGTPLTDVTQTTTLAGINYLRNSTLFTVGPSLQVSLPGYSPATDNS